jgi:hypothetical protein
MGDCHQKPHWIIACTPRWNVSASSGDPSIMDNPHDQPYLCSLLPCAPTCRTTREQSSVVWGDVECVLHMIVSFTPHNKIMQVNTNWPQMSGANWVGWQQTLEHVKSLNRMHAPLTSNANWIQLPEGAWSIRHTRSCKHKNQTDIRTNNKYLYVLPGAQSEHPRIIYLLYWVYLILLSADAAFFSLSV